MLQYQIQKFSRTKQGLKDGGRGSRTLEEGQRRNFVRWYRQGNRGVTSRNGGGWPVKFNIYSIQNIISVLSEFL